MDKDNTRSYLIAMHYNIDKFVGCLLVYNIARRLFVRHHLRGQWGQILRGKFHSGSGSDLSKSLL